MQVERIVQNRATVRQIINEINAHWDLSLCEAMVALQEIYIDQKYLYLVLDYQREGSIIGKIFGSVNFTEAQAKFIMLQLLLSIDFLNKRDLVHRDLKIDNILINKIVDGDYYVKIADFGLAIQLPEDGSFLYEVCGTPTYIAPEMLRREGYREKCDIFSLGSILFNLLSGRFLFNGASNKETLEANKTCEFARAI